MVGKLKGETRFRGVGVSPGRTVGRVCLFRQALHQSVPDYRVAEDARGREHQRLQVALEAVGRQLAAGVQRVTTASDHRDAALGRGWGVLIKELRLLARAVFAVDAEGVLRYRQLVRELTAEPDYEAALAAVRALL